MPVEYVAIRITEDARDCINRAKLPKETMSEAIIRCCSDMQQPRDNDTTTQQLELSLYDTRKEIQDLQERYDSLQALVNSLQTTVNNAINQSIEVRNTPLISDTQQPCDNHTTQSPLDNYTEIQPHCNENATQQTPDNNMAMQQHHSTNATMRQSCDNDGVETTTPSVELVKPDTKGSADEGRIPVTDEMIKQLRVIIKAGIEKEGEQKKLLERLSLSNKSVLTSFITTSQKPPKTMRESDYDKLLSYARENCPHLLQS